MKSIHRWIPIAMALTSSVTASAADLSYLQGLLSTTPDGGWVKASAGTFKEAWPTGLDLPPPTPGGPAAVPQAWSSFAWDSTRGNLLLFGGGHANYVGNEVYVWQGANGTWTRGTLPSKVDLNTQLVLGNGAPQSAHTYDSNNYVPINDRFVVLGGAAWNTGGSLMGPDGRTGPWWWDPSKADANKVGGADGTGWDPSRQGANAWQTRPYAPWVGLDAYSVPESVFGTTGYRTENGKDVIYVTMDRYSSGRPGLFRYELGDVTTPDTWQQIGSTNNSILYYGTATIDTRRGLFVRNTIPIAETTTDLAVWDLANNNPAHPELNRDFSVQLVDPDGVAVNLNLSTAIDYDAARDQYVMWDGRDLGTVWVTQAEYLSNGALDPEWTVRKFTSTTAAQPLGMHADGVLGKWKYVAELGAYVAMDAYKNTTSDAEIWLYKPLAAVPEPGTYALFLGGLALVGWTARRRRTA